jgi:oxygen-independent coproporphyrinogen-3 oxidase
MNWINLARAWLTRTKKPFIFLSEYDQKLDYLSLDNLGLYIHIPFCAKICSFCPYCKTVYQKELADNYINALIKEIHLVSKQVGSKKQVTSLYFGGGTPCLCIDSIKKIIDAIKQYFIITDGIGIELHPQDLTEDVLKQLKQAQITKISIGIQSFDEKCLSFLGRKNELDILKLNNLLMKYPFETVSMDLIFGIPGQTFESLKKDFEIAFECHANHVAIYPLIEFSFYKPEQKTTLRQKRKLINKILDYCQQKGYKRTSIWTFSKDNGHYSSMTRQNFLGFGCSATTLLRNQFKINTFDVQEYINRINNNCLPTALTCRFTKRQRMIYYLFWTAYSTVINPQDFENYFGESLHKNYGFEFFLARVLGFLRKKNNIYYLTKRGTYYYYYFERFYTLSYIDKMWNILRKQSFPQKIEL